MNEGNGPGLTNRRLGERSGSEEVTLNATEMPSHTHTARARNAAGNNNQPASNVWANDAGTQSATYSSDPADIDMQSDAIQNTGGGQSHTNMQPYLVIHFIIALTGIYPSRS